MLKMSAPETIGLGYKIILVNRASVLMPPKLLKMSHYLFARLLGYHGSQPVYE